MAEHRTWQATVFAGLVLVLAACGAALFAHVGIDLAGDVWLAHDTYDGVDHHSRSEMLGIGLSAALVAVLRLLHLAVREARTGRPAALISYDAICGRTPFRFVVIVILLTLPALMSMELLDVVTAGVRIDDVSDLLGGSVPLALTIVLPVATLMGLTVRCIARLIMSSHHGLVAAISRLIVLLARRRARPRERAEFRDARRSMLRRSILSRCSGKRGPPLRSS